MTRQCIPLGHRYKTVPKPFVITIVGAESSGKTTLTRNLAAHFGCPWIPEYAREFLPTLGRPYDEYDLEIIAERQLKAIMAFMSRESSADFSPNPLMGTTNDITSETKFQEGTLKSKIKNLKSKIIFVDGGMMNIRMWARIKYKKKIPGVEDALMNDVTDLYLLCRPQKKWDPDPLREAPDIIERAWIYNQYLEELVSGQKRVEIVNGKKEKKLKRAIRKIIFSINEIKT